MSTLRFIQPSSPSPPPFIASGDDIGYAVFKYAGAYHRALSAYAHYGHSTFLSDELTHDFNNRFRSIGVEENLPYYFKEALQHHGSRPTANSLKKIHKALDDHGSGTIYYYGAQVNNPDDPGYDPTMASAALLQHQLGTPLLPVTQATSHLGLIEQHVNGVLNNKNITDNVKRSMAEQALLGARKVHHELLKHLQDYKESQAVRHGITTPQQQPQPEKTAAAPEAPELAPPAHALVPEAPAMAPVEKPDAGRMKSKRVKLSIPPEEVAGLRQDLGMAEQRDEQRDQAQQARARDEFGDEDMLPLDVDRDELLRKMDRAVQKSREERAEKIRRDKQAMDTLIQRTAKQRETEEKDRAKALAEEAMAKARQKDKEAEETREFFTTLQNRGVDSAVKKSSNNPSKKIMDDVIAARKHTKRPTFADSLAASEAKASPTKSPAKPTSPTKQATPSKEASIPSYKDIQRPQVSPIKEAAIPSYKGIVHPLPSHQAETNVNVQALEEAQRELQQQISKTHFQSMASALPAHSTPHVPGSIAATLTQKQPQKEGRTMEVDSPGLTHVSPIADRPTQPEVARAMLNASMSDINESLYTTPPQSPASFKGTPSTTVKPLPKSFPKGATAAAAAHYRLMNPHDAPNMLNLTTHLDRRKQLFKTMLKSHVRLFNSSGEADRGRQLEDDMNSVIEHEETGQQAPWRLRNLVRAYGAMQIGDDKQAKYDIDEHLKSEQQASHLANWLNANALDEYSDGGYDNSSSRRQSSIVAQDFNRQLINNSNKNHLQDDEAAAQALQANDQREEQIIFDLKHSVHEVDRAMAHALEQARQITDSYLTQRAYATDNHLESDDEGFPRDNPLDTTFTKQPELNNLVIGHAFYPGAPELINALTNYLHQNGGTSSYLLNARNALQANDKSGAFEENILGFFETRFPAMLNRILDMEIESNPTLLNEFKQRFAPYSPPQQFQYLDTLRQIVGSEIIPLLISGANPERNVTQAGNLLYYLTLRNSETKEHLKFDRNFQGDMGSKLALSRQPMSSKFQRNLRQNAISNIATRDAALGTLMAMNDSSQEARMAAAHFMKLNTMVQRGGTLTEHEEYFRDKFSTMDLLVNDEAAYDNANKVLSEALDNAKQLFFSSLINQQFNHITVAKNILPVLYTGSPNHITELNSAISAGKLLFHKPSLQAGLYPTAQGVSLPSSVSMPGTVGIPVGKTANPSTPNRANAPPVVEPYSFKTHNLLESDDEESPDDETGDAAVNAAAAHAMNLNETYTAIHEPLTDQQLINATFNPMPHVDSSSLNASDAMSFGNILNTMTQESLAAMDNSAHAHEGVVVKRNTRRVRRAKLVAIMRLRRMLLSKNELSIAERSHPRDAKAKK